MSQLKIQWFSDLGGSGFELLSQRFGTLPRVDLQAIMRLATYTTLPGVNRGSSERPKQHEPDKQECGCKMCAAFSCLMIRTNGRRL